MSSKGDNARLFDSWAARYDDAVQEESFPFIGYARVLEEITRLCAPRPGLVVVDMGTGTGELAKCLADKGCQVWGVDFSQKMLAEAEKKVPQGRWVQADLRHGWPSGLPDKIHCVVSSYALHHFPLDEKVRLLALWSERVAAGSAVIVGDIAFRTVQQRAEARHRWREMWDVGEFYWSADETLHVLEAVGLRGEYVQVSSCAGAFKIERDANSQARRAHRQAEPSRIVLCYQGGTMARTRVVESGSLAGVVWFGGWLFTIAFAQLAWWQSLIGLVIWPYYLGVLARGG